MHIHSAPSSQRFAASGLSLVELLVALAISLLVLFALTNVFIATKANTRLQGGMSRINENTQVAADALARDIRLIAHIGCPALGEVSRGFRRLSRDSIDDTGGANSFAMTPTSVVRVFPADGTLPGTALAGSPVIDVTHAASAGSHLLAPTTSRRVAPNSTIATSLLLRSDPGIRMPAVSDTNSYPTAVISDCATAETFQVVGVNAANTAWRVDPFNLLRTLYSTDARVMPVTRTQYFVGNHVRPGDERSTRAIFKRTMLADGYNWNPIPQPLVHDIDSMAITMELDTDGSFASDSSVASTAAFNPSQVVGLTINLILKTPDSVRGTGGVAVQRTSSATVGVRARTS